MSPEGKEAFRKDDQSGHFIVTAATEGRHQVCLYNNASHPRWVLPFGLEFWLDILACCGFELGSERAPR